MNYAEPTEEDIRSAVARLPADLPSIKNAKLPAVYERAKTAIAECERIDECREWADKMEALASYARQVEDDTLYNAAMRIKVRAVRRCGELFKQLERPEQGGRPPKNNGRGGPTVSQAGKAAGLSKDQQVQAVRVANVPADEFEAAVESENPPTLTELAERGTKARPRVDHLEGRDPEEFRLSTYAQGEIRRMAEAVAKRDPIAIARGAVPAEFQAILANIEICKQWLSRIENRIKEQLHRKGE